MAGVPAPRAGDEVRMKGIVRYINLTNARAAVETVAGFTIFEVLERCALDFGDEITGPLDSTGRETLRNVTKGESFDVSIEYMHCSRTEAVESLA